MHKTASGFFINESEMIPADKASVLKELPYCEKSSDYCNYGCLAGSLLNDSQMPSAYC